jgi:hypothetical protein
MQILFLAQYNKQVYDNTVKLRSIILESLPGIIEQLDVRAKMIAYCYGQKYADMVCTIIPSKKTFKLAFYKGAELPDPHQMLKGTGKFSRYVEIKSEEEIHSRAIRQLLEEAYAACKKRMAK